MTWAARLANLSVMGSRWNGVVDLWSAWVWADAVVAVGVGGLTWHFMDPVALLPEGRAELYGGAAGLVGILGALATIALSVYGGGQGRRLREVRNRDTRGDLRRNLMAAFVVPPLGALACWVAQALEFALQHGIAAALVVSAITWSIATFARQTWLLGHLMELADLDASERQCSPPVSPRAANTRTRLDPLVGGRDERAPINFKVR